MVSIELHETYKWNTMIIKINKSEFHLHLTIRSICSRLLKITTAFSGFLVRGCNSKAVVNKESMQQVFPHLQPHHPLDFWTLEGTQKTQWFWIESPEFEKGFFTLINFFFVFSTILTQCSTHEYRNQQSDHVWSGMDWKQKFFISMQNFGWTPSQIPAKEILFSELYSVIIHQEFQTCKQFFLFCFQPLWQSS